MRSGLKGATRELYSEPLNGSSRNVGRGQFITTRKKAKGLRSDPAGCVKNLITRDHASFLEQFGKCFALLGDRAFPIIVEQVVIGSKLVVEGSGHDFGCVCVAQRSALIRRAAMLIETKNASRSRKTQLD